MPICSNPLDPLIDLTYSNIKECPGGCICPQTVVCTGDDFIIECPTPIDLPPNPDAAVCVNDTIDRIWAPPPPTNPGCHPLSLNVSNTLDETINSPRLESKMDYIGQDPCMPRINLEFIFPRTRGGGSSADPPNQPVDYGWGITRAAKYFKIGPNECTNAVFESANQFFAQAYNPLAFLPTQACPGLVSDCDLRKLFAKNIPNGIIGPILGSIESSSAPSFTGQCGTPSTPVDYGWEYKWKPEAGISYGNSSGTDDARLNTSEFAGKFAGNSLLLNETGNIARNIKENDKDLFGGTCILTPGANMGYAAQAGFKPVAIADNTLVLVYGVVPEEWVVGSDCSKAITWFIDVPNAFDGACVAAPAQPSPLTSDLPIRTTTAAGKFFGGASDADRV